MGGEADCILLRSTGLAESALLLSQHCNMMPKQNDAKADCCSSATSRCQRSSSRGEKLSLLAKANQLTERPGKLHRRQQRLPCGRPGEARRDESHARRLVRSSNDFSTTKTQRQFPAGCMQVMQPNPSVCVLEFPEQFFRNIKLNKHFLKCT